LSAWDLRRARGDAGGAPPADRRSHHEETAMLDLLFVLLMLGGFGTCLAYTIACERL
jgi:hypothetical protein